MDLETERQKAEHFWWQLVAGVELIEITEWLTKDFIDLAVLIVRYQGNIYSINLREPKQRPVPFREDAPPFPMPWDVKEG